MVHIQMETLAVEVSSRNTWAHQCGWPSPDDKNRRSYYKRKGFIRHLQGQEFEVEIPQESARIRHFTNASFIESLAKLAGVFKGINQFNLAIISIS